ncbi:MAG: hypothetical protein LUF68_05025, partial [Clostridiales bacterium]|nr:hypothetical protein [Clostridiales bacterium]
MAQQINAGESNSYGSYYYECCYELTADLNLNGYDWKVIGNSSAYAFTGTFEGNGHTISGLYMDDGSIAGLFGYLGSNATVQNLNISGDVTGSSGAAGLLASQMTTKSSSIQISNVTVSGTVMVRDISSYGTSGSFSGNAGGLIGAAKTSSVTLTECKNEATVSTDGSGTTALGGLIGSVLLGGNYTVTVERCCNLGEITSHAYAGGLIGSTYVISSKNGVLTVSDSYNLGSVTGSFAGGIIGYRGSATYSGTQTMSNCYNAGAISDESGYSCVLGAEKSGTELTTYSNCYYLSGSNNGGTVVERDGITKVDVLSASSLGENFTDSTETIGTVTFCTDDYATVKVGDATVESASANGYPYLSWLGSSPISQGYVAFQVSMTDPYVISTVTAENGVILTDSLEDKTFLAVVTGNDTVTIDDVLPTTLTVTGDNATFAFVSGFYETTNTGGQYTVGQNTTVTFTVKAASGYAVTSVSSVSGAEGAVQELTPDEDGVYTLSIDAESVTVSIAAEPTYTFYYVLTNAAEPEILSGSATLGGSLAAPTIKVINGDTVTFSTTPDSGYVLTPNSVAFTVTKTDAETSEQYEYTAQTLTVDDSGVYSLTVSELLADGETALAGSTMNIVAEAASLAVDSAADLTFTGSEITPDVVVTVDGDVLSAEYYTLSYSDNIDVGTASVTATMQNGYVGTLTGTFSIEKKELTEDDFTVSETADYNYGAAVEVEIVSDLELDVDYTVRYDNNIDAGTNAKVTISGKGNYGGTLTYEFAIVAAELSSDAVTIEVTGELNYTGEEVKPAVAVSLNGVSMTEGTDYELAYASATEEGNLVDAGNTGIVTVTFQGNYSGTATATYTIAKADQTLTVNHATQELPVSASKNLATLNLVSGNQTELVYGLAEGEGFTLDGSILTTPETEKAEATITIYAAEGDNYNASEPIAVTVTTVNKAEVSVAFADGTATYTGEALTYEAASVEVEETDGTWTYVYYDADGTKLDSAPTDAGTYTVTATYTSGDSTGTASTHFTIEPQPVEATVALTD